MKDFDNISDTITKYLNGKLDVKELATFSKQLKTNPELKEEVVFRRIVMEGAKSLSNDQLRTQIKSTIKELNNGSKADEPFQANQAANDSPPATARIVPMGKKLMAIAASLLILVAIGGLWNANRNYTNSSLAMANHDLPSPAIGLKGDIENNATLFKEVADAYSSKDYGTAVELLSSVQPSPSYNTAQYHLGNLYLKIQQPEKAIGIFEGLSKTGDVRYEEEVQWLLAIAHLENNDIASTEKQLGEILQNTDHSMYDKASNLQNQLNSFWRILVL